MRRTFIGAVLVLLALVAAFHQHILQHAISTQESKRLLLGDKVPDFKITDLTGKAVTLSELQKRTDSGVVSLTFWCTFCHSCRMMDARFQKLEAEFKNKATVIGLDVSAADTAKKVENFAKEKKFSVPVFMDAEGKVADLFAVRMTTTTVVIDKSGVLRYWGQFGGEDTPYAGNALRGILEGKDVPVRETSASG